MGEGEKLTRIDADGRFAERMQAADVTSQHRIAIAVSGGADSMALCLLAARWKRRSRPELAAAECDGLFAFVVDHGLRSGSAEEAVRVQKWVSNTGLTCNILKCTWAHGIPALGRLQESARNARYALLAQACHHVGVQILLTAHHADDQAELFILRLSRCSGIAGLAGIASATHFHSRAGKGCSSSQLLLIRPLLNFVKEELYNICQKSGQDWIEDPTNVNLNFARNRIRKALKGASLMAIRTEIQQLVAFCRKIRSILDRDRDKLLSEVSQVSQEWGHITLEVEKLLSNGASEAVLHRTVAALLQFAAQKMKPPRGRAVSSVIEHLRAKKFKGAFTVAGCNLFPAAGSRGLIFIICCSADSPPPLGPTAICLDQSVESLSSEFSASSEILPSLSHVGLENPKPVEVIDGTMSAAIFSLALDIKTPRAAVDEFKGLGLISDAGARLLQDLASDISLDMCKSPVNQLEEGSPPNKTSTSSQSLKVPLTFGASEYFMDRFVVSVSSRKQRLERKDAQLCVPHKGTELSPVASCCLLRQKMWIRHFEERDWVYLSRLARGPDTHSSRDFNTDVLLTDSQRPYCSNLDGTSLSRYHAQAANGQLRPCTAPVLVSTSQGASSLSFENSSSDDLHSMDACRGPWFEIERCLKAKKALTQLRSVPKLVRRGLPVIATTQGLLLGMPSVGFRHCPLVSMKAIFCPRVPLGGPKATWL